MEKLLEIVLFIIFSLITTMCSASILHCLTKLITKTNYNRKKVLFSSAILLPFSTLNNYIMLYIPSIKLVGPVIALFACTIVIASLYKCKLFRTLLIVLAYSIVTFLTDMIFGILVMILGMEVTDVTSNPKLHCLLGIIPNTLDALTVLFITNLFFKKNLGNIFKANYKYILYQTITIIICLIPSMYLLFSSLLNYSVIFLIISALQLIIVSLFSIIYLKNGILHKDTELELENTKLHNKALATINENIRGFKHDMGNMVQAINGYLAVGNIDGVKSYCKNLLHGFNDINLLSILSPKIINDPAIYGIVVSKMLHARDNNLTLSLDIGLDVSQINFPSFELSRIIGILLDNAIEASLESDERKLKLEMYHDQNRNCDIIIIGNSVKDVNKLDIIKMFEKDYSTKENPSGFGLYEVLKFFKKNNKGDIVPNIDYESNFFTQTLTFDR